MTAEELVERVLARDIQREAAPSPGAAALRDGKSRSRRARKGVSTSRPKTTPTTTDATT